MKNQILLIFAMILIANIAVAGTTPADKASAGTEKQHKLLKQQLIYGGCLDVSPDNNGGWKVTCGTTPAYCATYDGTTVVDTDCGCNTPQGGLATAIIVGAPGAQVIILGSFSGGAVIDIFPATLECQ